MVVLCSVITLWFVAIIPLSKWDGILHCILYPTIIPFSCSLDEYSDLPEEECSTVLLLGVTKIPTSPVATRRLLPGSGGVVTASSATATSIDEKRASVTNKQRQQLVLHGSDKHQRYHPQHLHNQLVRRNSSAASRRNVVVVRRNSSTKRAEGRRILQVSCLLS